MTMWLLLDGAAGVVLGCVTLGIVLVIRCLGAMAVVTGNTGEPEHGEKIRQAAANTLT